ncbi:SH3 domain-containing protein [bacterium]|nr:SH3 domain-containing protein [bacterium]
MDTDTDTDLFELVDGASFTMPAGGFTNITIRVRTVPETVGSVRFLYNGNVIRTANTAPYAVTAAPNGDYQPIQAGFWAPGSYTLTAEVYAGADASGGLMSTDNISFRISSVESALTMLPTPVPAGFSESASPSQSHNLISAQSSENVLVFEATANNVNELLDIIEVANSDTNNVYRINLQPGTIYSVPSTEIPINIFGKVTLVGNLNEHPYDEDTSTNEIAAIKQSSVILEPAITLQDEFLDVQYDVGARLDVYNLVVRNFSTPTASKSAINNSGELNVYNSLFLNNRTSGWGGAITTNSGVSRAPVKTTLVNTVFRENQSTGNFTNTGGGALMVQFGGVVDIHCSTFYANNSRNRGGAIHNRDTGGTVFIQNSNFQSNTAGRGWGAIWGANTVPDSTIALNNYWEPSVTNTQNADNSVTSNVPTQPELDTPERVTDLQCASFMVPPPPSSQCSAIVVIEGEANNGLLRDQPNGATIASVPKDSIVTVLGRSGNWYRIRTQQGTGWLDGIILEIDSNCDDTELPILNSNGSLLIATYDYNLSEPPLDWLNLPCSATEETTANWTNCSRIVLRVFYEEFQATTGRVPKMSDVMAAVYRNELSVVLSGDISGS